MLPIFDMSSEIRGDKVDALCERGSVEHGKEDQDGKWEYFMIRCPRCMHGIVV